MSKELEVLEIIKEIVTITEDKIQDKIQDILRCKDYEEYITLYWERELTEEDFNLLKEYFKNE